MSTTIVYSLEEHRHRFAAWAASRAASVKECRFKVKQGKAILDAAGLSDLLKNPAHLPSPRDLDGVHREWRSRIIVAAQVEGLSLTHGVAAKLINVYFKAGLVCGGYDKDPRVQALHPPIDSLLLKELAERDLGGLRREWNVAGRIRWSRFTSDEYEHVVSNIRMALGPNAPMWTIEQYWRGYQSSDED